MSADVLPMSGSVPTRAERERAASLEYRLSVARREAAHQVAWVRRHSPGQTVTTTILSEAQEILAQEHVYVVRVEACECGQNGTLGVSQWRVDEALRDAAMDVLIANMVREGDELFTYRLRLPNRLGSLSDESVDTWVDEVPLEDAGVDEVVSHRYGSCPLCGRGEVSLGAEEALDMLARMVEEGDDGRQVLASVIRRTGRRVDVPTLPPPPESMEDEFGEWAEYLTELDRQQIEGWSHYE